MEASTPLVLGSQSPRRRELLGRLGLHFDIRTADIDETMDPHLPPRQEVARVSAAKALAIRARVPGDALILTADTIVVLDDRIMGKPHSPEQAFAMLSALSGRTHHVYTAVTLTDGLRTDTQVECTEVTFRPLDRREILAYVQTGEPMDKAGAYGIQGMGSCLVSHLNGDYFNVMGLPLCRLTGMLRSFGVEILGL